MDPFPINLLGREPIRKRINFVHKDQLAFYGSEDPDYSCAQFRTRYRFQENTVRWLAMKLEDDIGPIAYTNNALNAKQRLCCALRFYSTGTFQSEVGEGISQSTMHRIISRVSDALARKANSLIKFSIDENILQRVSDGFFGFSGSRFILSVANLTARINMSKGFMILWG